MRACHLAALVRQKNRSGGQRPLSGIRSHTLPRSTSPLAALAVTLAFAPFTGCTPTADPGTSSATGGTSGSNGTGGTPAGEGGGGGTSSAGTGGSTGTGGTSASSGGTTGGDGGSGGTSSAGTGGSGNPGTGGNSSAGTGGAPSDAGADTPASTPGCNAIFCDDFETFTAGAAPAGMWKTNIARGALAVDEKKAFSGARSVRFTHNGAPANMFIELRAPVLPRPTNVMYGRMMYYLTQTPSGQYSHFELVRGGGALPSGGRAQLNTGGENGKVVLNYEPGDCTKYSKIALPDKKWACYQWQFDGPKNQIQITIDGTPVTDIPVAPAGQCWKAPMMIDAVHIGWESYHGNQPVELWIDDVAVGDQPIPCPTGTASKP